MKTRSAAAAAALLLSPLVVSSAQAQTCIGTCGTLGADGVVTSPPNGSATYQFISTNNGTEGAGQIASVGGTNGSSYVTQSFSAAAGDKLDLFFNYVTSDGAGFSDYAFAELLQNGSNVAYLFTARTQPTGDTSPGFGLPANSSTLTPGSTPIIPGGPAWSPLGSDSGLCYSAGCGYTGWIGSTYEIANAGTYQLRFGVTNFADSAYQSGLAFAGVSINDVPIPGGVPEPATWALMILGFGAVGGAMRRRQAVAANVRFA